MVCGICCLLYLVLSLTGFTHQSQSTKTNMMMSLKNLVIDNSRSTVTFNSTMLRKLFALSANRPGMEYHEYGSLLFFMHRHAMSRVLPCPSYWFCCFEDRRVIFGSLAYNLKHESVIFSNYCCLIDNIWKPLKEMILSFIDYSFDRRKYLRCFDILWFFQINLSPLYFLSPPLYGWYVAVTA